MRCSCGGTLPCPHKAPVSPVETTAGSEQRPDHAGVIRPADGREAMWTETLRFLEGAMDRRNAENAALTAEVERFDRERQGLKAAIAQRDDAIEALTAQRDAACDEANRP